MHAITWILQLGLGAWFVAFGVTHLAMPAGLPDQMAWMHDLPRMMHVVSGVAEIAGGIGLVLPSLTRIKPMLTPLAGAGLIVVMLSGALWHLPRGEYQSIALNLVLIALLVVVVQQRSRTRPIEPR